MNEPLLNPGQIRLLVILIYMLILLSMGVLASRLFRGTKQDFLLASHSIGPVLLLLSLFGTTMTAFALVGSTGEAYRKGIGIYGLMASASGIVHSLCFFLIGIKLWKFGRRHGHLTQIQYFRDRLDSPLIGFLLFPFLVGLTIPYLLVGVIGGGAVIQGMTSGAFPEWFPALDGSGQATPADGALPEWLGSGLICLVVVSYVFIGGMRGTAWANGFQTLVFVILGVVTFVLLAFKLGGETDLLASIRAVTERVDVKYLTREAIPPTYFLSYLLIPLSAAMFPHLFQHWLTARSAETFKLAVVCHPLFILAVWLPCVMLGIWATTLELPPSVAANQNQILPYLVASQLSPLLAGLLTAGILAAIMSSLDSQFLCLGSIFTNDVVDRFLGRNRLSDRSIVWITRSFVVLIVGVTYWISLSKHPSIFSLGVWSFSGFAGLFPVVFASLYWRRFTEAGAISSILATAGSWLILFRASNWGANKEFVVTLPGSELPFHPVVPIFACSVFALLVTTRLTKPPRQSVLDRYFD